MCKFKVGDIIYEPKREKVRYWKVVAYTGTHYICNSYPKKEMENYALSTEHAQSFVLVTNVNKITENKGDMVNSPNHYLKGGYECQDIIKAITENCNNGYVGALIFNVIKYVWRFDRKDGLQDLKKARKYLNDLIEYMEDKNKNE